jgi:hypothetical protein
MINIPAGLRTKPFMVSPSFYAIVGGGVIGAMTNLLTNLPFNNEAITRSCGFWLSILSLLVSTACWVFISISLEEIRSAVNEGGILTRQPMIRMEIERKAQGLWTVLAGGLATLGFAVWLLVSKAL